MATQEVTQKPNNRLLIILGILWLLLAGGIVYSQLSGPASIEIEWVTETEFETAGFNLYRSEEPDGEFVQINDQLIPSEGDPASGASYSYADKSVIPNQAYYYQLEEVEYDNSRERYDVGAGQSNTWEWWVLLLVGISVIVGLFLLITAYRQEKKTWGHPEPQDPPQMSSGKY